MSVQSDGQQRDIASSAREKGILLTVLFWGVAIACFIGIISIAYDKYEGVGSWDQLTVMGPTAVGLLQMNPMVTFVVLLASVIGIALSRRSWIVPVVGLVLVISMFIATIATMRPDSPVIGG